jgi:tRNA dimethylallyltransferase
MPDVPLICIVGPTASGKSELALRLAEQAGAEIVSCDSLQVYRGLDVGSAKPTAAEQARVPHHLIDVADPDETFSAARYAELARAALRDIAARGRRALVVGGTGLYLRALLVGLFEGPARDEPLRRRLEALAARFGDARLHRLLRRVDPGAAARLEPRDRVRVVRALEVFHATGRALSEHLLRPGRPLAGFDVLTLALDPPREELRRRVEARTDAMLARGLIDEARALVTRGYSPALRPLQAIGYRQALEVVAGRLSRAEARRDIVHKTMQYAKRQRTWFRHQARAQWHAGAETAAQAARAFWRAGGAEE